MDQNKQTQDDVVAIVGQLREEIKGLKTVIESVESQLAYDRNEIQKISLIESEINHIKKNQADTEAKMRRFLEDLFVPVFEKISRALIMTDGKTTRKSLFSRISGAFKRG